MRATHRPTLRAAALAITLSGGLGAAIGVAPLRAAESPTPVDPLAARALELEADLVKTPALYLVLDSGQRRLEVRSRGVVLDQVALESVALLHYRPLIGRGHPEVPDAPSVLTVVEGPGDSYRDVIAPDALKPYVPEDERTEEEVAADPKKELPIPPSSYFVKLANGWQLGIFDRPPATHFFARYVQSIESGWKRLLGRPRDTPPVISLAMAPDDARRLHHVFRTDLALLVLPAGK